MIGWIVGNMHVCTKDRDVVREFYRRIRKGNTDIGTRAQRKAIYREALKEHHANQDLVREFRL